MIAMDSRTESWLAIAMGIVIFIANTFWLLFDQSYTVQGWLAAAIIIYIADIVWIWADLDLMRKSK
jgi:hypothetical protein